MCEHMCACVCVCGWMCIFCVSFDDTQVIYIILPEKEKQMFLAHVICISSILSPQ